MNTVLRIKTKYHIKLGALIVVFLLLLVGMLLFGKSNKSKTKKFEGVPSTYVECMRTDTQYLFSDTKRSELQCSYYVVSNGDNPKNNIDFEKCLSLGGHNPGYETGCELVYYNPEYDFPETYEDCVAGDKGEYFVTGEGNMCRVSVESYGVRNEEDVTLLINECRSRGGLYSENTIRISESATVFKKCAIVFMQTSVPRVPVVRLFHDETVYAGLQGSTCWPVGEPAEEVLCFDTVFPDPEERIVVTNGDILEFDIIAHDIPNELIAQIYISSKDLTPKRIQLPPTLHPRLKVDLISGEYIVLVLGNWDAGDTSFAFKINVQQ